MKDNLKNLLEENCKQTDLKITMQEIKTQKRMLKKKAK